MEEAVKQSGFDSLEEFNKMIANLDLTKPGKLKAFREWQENDGTKDGLLKLEV